MDQTCSDRYLRDSILQQSSTTCSITCRSNKITTQIPNTTYQGQEELVLREVEGEAPLRLVMVGVEPLVMWGEGAVRVFVLLVEGAAPEGD